MLGSKLYHASKGGGGGGGRVVVREKYLTHDRRNDLSTALLLLRESGVCD